MDEIIDMLHEYATEKSIQRGLAIFKSGGVIDLNIEELDDEGGFDIRGVVRGENDLYTIGFEISPFDIEDCNCSCPYNYSGFCKHLVAGIYAASAYLKSNSVTESIDPRSIVERNTSTVFHVPIDEEGGIDLLPYTLLQGAGKAHSLSQAIQRYEWEDNKLKVHLFDYTMYKPGLVFIAILGKKRVLSLRSFPKKNVQTLSMEELAALFFFQENFSQNLMLRFSHEKREKFLNQVANSYGFDSYEEAKQYLEVNLDLMEEPVRLKDAYRGLLSLEKINELTTSDFSRKNGLQERLLSKGTVSKKASNNSLFILLSPSVIHHDFTLLIAKVFTGRKKKDGKLAQNGLSLYSDLSYTSKPALSDKDVMLVNAIENTSADAFRQKYGRLLNDFDNAFERGAFVYDKNIEELSTIWSLLSNNANEIFLQPNTLQYRLLASDFLPVELVAERPQVRLSITTEENLVSVTFYLDFTKGSYSLEEVEWINPISGVINGREVFLLPSGAVAVTVFELLQEQKFLVMVKSHFEMFFQNTLMPLSTYFKIDIVSLPEHMSYKRISEPPSTKKLYLKELDKFILLRPFLTYGDHEQNILESGNTFIGDAKGKIITYERQSQIEEEWMEEIKQLHPSFEKGTNHDFFSLHVDQFVEDYWFLKMTETMQEKGVEVYGFNEFKNFKFAPSSPTIQVNASSGQDWFDLEVSITVGNEYISLKDVRKAIVAKDKYIKLGNGQLAVLPEDWVKKLEKYLRIGKVTKDSIQISKLRFNAVDDIFESLDQQSILKEIAEKRQKLKNFNALKKVSFPEMNATLRDYQEDGFQWLHFLHEFNWGGILADDMGLGKTLQMLTFLKSVVHKGTKANLVVLPTSLLFNWQNEIEKFCPDLSFHVYYGTSREKPQRNWKDYDLILTTYGLLVSDIEHFRKIKFGYVVLDESQAIKNPLSKRFKAVSVLKAKNRIAMTGTPIENNTMDLYAQLTFANPGIFVSAEQFKKSYAIPIDRNGDKVAAEELNKMIHPFVLRRTKEMVAKELPPKIEDVIYCEMEPAQRKVYDAYRNQYRNDILGKIETDGLESSKLHVLQALIKMRQICNSTGLLSDEEDYGSESIKIKELVRHIQEKTGNHKLLIFSQFVNMLQLIRKELEGMNIDHAYLDGSTSQKMRQTEVERFQEDEEVRVFLISLKAGGTGLNLMAADYVYIVDPWWNPAVENQAIDRCYRIGQDKKVIAYRMICKDTLEEKMMRYKQQKQAVADAIVQTDDHVMKQISKEDIAELFS